MRNTPTEDQLRQELRVRICPKCPLRAERGVRSSPDVPNRCEPECPLFLKLGTLIRRAELLDPLLGSREHLLEQLVQESSGPPALKPLTDHRRGKSSLHRFGPEVARLVAARVGN